MLHHTVQRWAKTYLQAGHSAGLVVEDISHLTCREPPDSVPEDVRCLLGFLRPPPQEFEELLNPPLENWGNEAAGCAGLAPDPDIARSPLDEDGSPTGYGPAGATASQEEVDKAALRRIRGTIESVVALQPHWRSVHTGEPFPWISILTSSAVGLSSNKYAEDLLPRYDCEYAKPYDADNPPQSSRDMRGIANFMLLKQLQSSHREQLSLRRRVPHKVTTVTMKLIMSGSITIQGFQRETYPFYYIVLLSHPRRPTAASIRRPKTLLATLGNTACPLSGHHRDQETQMTGSAATR
ncbi:hypothetical protein C8Q77DRAFT_146085 [Trametes polyzona]|nr:hypothetical protein C8Q77DRAFT_146085 [Trametes polyzona]